MKKSLILVLFTLIIFNATKAQYNSIVAKDGSGNYTTVQAAIDAAPINTATPYVILIKNGKYYEKVTIASNKPNIQLIGESVAGVTINYDDYAGKPISGGGTIGTQGSATVTINATDFVAVNITFTNSFNYDSASAAGVTGLQAVAVVVNADRAAFKNCRFIGMQDTLYTKGNGTPRHYFYKCYIDGIIDFIFGSSIAVFDSCVIYPKTRTGTGSSYITAANTTIGQLYGYVFKDCKIPANSGATLYYLGRPWGNATAGITAYNRTTFLNTQMGNSINPLGWSVWDAGTNTNIIFYGEYKSKKNDGSLVDVSNRVSWSKQFTDADTAGYNILNMFSGWNPCNVRADFCTSPMPEIAVSNFKGIKSGNKTNFSWNTSWSMAGINFSLYRSADNKQTFQLINNTISPDDTAVNFSTIDVLPPSCSSYFYFIKSSRAGNATTYTDTIEVSSTPTIASTSNSIINFLQGSLIPSSSQNVTINGVNLVTNITIKAPANFEISTDNTNWVNSTSFITLTPTSGSIANTILYVRLNANAVGIYSDTVKLTTTCTSLTITKNIVVSGLAQSNPLSYYNTIQQWNLTTDNQDLPVARSITLDSTVILSNKFYVSNGTQVPAVAAYSSLFGMAFGATANGDGSWTTALGGPGGNLKRTHYVEVTLRPVAAQNNGHDIAGVRVDSLVFYAAFYGTTSNTKLAVAYSKSNFTLDSADVTGGRDLSGNTLPSSANGAFATPIVLANQTSGVTAQYGLALNANNAVHIQSGDSLKIRIYYSCGSSSAGRYALLKTVQAKGFGAITLPLKITSFKAASTLLRDGVIKAKLDWKTANEVNVSHYNIQRSIDGKEFYTIDKVNAFNKSNNEYSITDELKTKDQYPKTLYYRIEAIDNDGKKTYSEIKALTLKSKTLIGIAIYPNPAKSSTTISCADGLKHINVLDVNGKLVFSKMLNNCETYQLNTSNYIHGLYTLQVITAKAEIKIQKLVIE